ncbi:Phenylalanine-tRNA ligase beta subunit [Candidatus Saccharibacteria bacterium RAAC3_TM7_1]|nr:Phenylalanine-tRNA ligase beta subunit [Candidatus Saccharibacteria bacterium RAAC3_TM7_1]HCZ28870.1 phenylalanine--tRNA ligase subunit beta [Candidatus Saccharibacteria bacterium]
MRVSLNQIKQFIDFELPPVDELVKKINSQLGKVEETINLGERYEKAVIVKVVSCEDHPNADRLHVCRVDDGGVVQDVERDENGHVQVVCGAPNVHTDMYAVWLPPSSTVPASFAEKEPFVLEKREIRGVMSNGMLAAGDELAINSDHDGIIEIDPDEWKPSDEAVKPGVSFAKLYGLDDHVIDIENKMFTHRPDLFGQLGVAREIAGIHHQAFTSPDWYAGAPEFSSASGLEFEVSNNADGNVPRLMTVAIKDVVVKPSPLWLQCALMRLGAKPINNIVDVTNYIMLLTAQPVHAYDYDKLRGHKLVARMALPGEEVTLLNHKQYALDVTDIVIADAEGPIGLAGIMGGGDSEVSDETKNVVLEVANFDMYTIRKSSMHHGLFTDASNRFNKGQSPLQNSYVMNLLMTSLRDVAGGEQASDVFDSGTDRVNEPIAGSVDFINQRLGLGLSASEMRQLLENVEVKIGLENGITVEPPFWRTDIRLAEDVVEEVGRLYGFDKLPLELPLRTMAPTVKDAILTMKTKVRESLSRAGANEVLTYSFVHERVLEQSGQDSAQAYRLSNALSPDLQYYRLSLTPSLLDKIHMNIKAGHDEFALFEFGKAHRKDDMDDEGLPREYERLAFVYAAKKSSETAYYKAKHYLETLAPEVSYIPLRDFSIEYPIFDQLAQPFEPGRAAVVMSGEHFVGVIGEYKASVRRAFKLPETTAGFEIFQSFLVKQKPATYQPLSRFPSVTQDISLRIPVATTYAAVFELARQATNEAASNLRFDISPLALYQPEGSDVKTVTLRFKVTSDNRTLKEEEVSSVVAAVAAAGKDKLGAERI